MALPPPPIRVDASHGTATHLAGLMGDGADGCSPPGGWKPADMRDEDPEPPAEGNPGGPLAIWASTSPALQHSSPTLPWRR